MREPATGRTEDPPGQDEPPPQPPPAEPSTPRDGAATGEPGDPTRDAAPVAGDQTPGKRRRYGPL